MKATDAMIDAAMMAGGYTSLSMRAIVQDMLNAAIPFAPPDDEGVLTVKLGGIMNGDGESPVYDPSTGELIGWLRRRVTLKEKQQDDAVTRVLEAADRLVDGNLDPETGACEQDSAFMDLQAAVSALRAQEGQG